MSVRPGSWKPCCRDLIKLHRASSQWEDEPINIIEGNGITTSRKLLSAEMCNVVQYDFCYINSGHKWFSMVVASVWMPWWLFGAMSMISRSVSWCRVSDLNANCAHSTLNSIHFRLTNGCSWETASRSFRVRIARRPLYHFTFWDHTFPNPSFFNLGSGAVLGRQH